MPPPTKGLPNYYYQLCDGRLQIFDAVIVLTSFGLDLVFVEGITAAQSESAIALLIIFLLWRILRIVNGIALSYYRQYPNATLLYLTLH